MTEEELQAAETYLAKNDSALATLISSQEITFQPRSNDYFAALCRSIIGQQVSVKAASAIYARFEQTTKLDPDNVLKLTEFQVKNIGLSRQKTAYITDLARHFHHNQAVYQHLETQSDDEVIKELTDIKGIGVWTAQMFLIFTLGRLDIFAPDDLGIQRAMQKLYGWNDAPKKHQLEQKAEKWRPHRTVACLHLWHSLDNQL